MRPSRMGKLVTGSAVAGLMTVIGASVGLLAAHAQSKPKVSFVYVGPIGDHGWSYQHHQGLQAIKAEFGDKIDTNYVENVPEGPDAERVIDQLAATGSTIIFTTSFGFMNPTVKVAARYPNVKFEHATGFKQGPNLATYDARFYEGRHVIGLIAGKMTKTNTIGYVATFPIPAVVMGINAAYLAAKSVNPNVKFKVVWVSTWFDPAKETAAAKTLVDQGADILMQHTDSPAPVQYAEEKGIYAFGQASDMAQYGPNAQLTAIVDNWNPYYF